ncbi:MAG TPA: HNH endonuclease, partial [Candidatus Onthomorpha intestinigallinarum]|nr:HNH endonuclease [Candidatus Onthomorpha intestinigallinarum]
VINIAGEKLLDQELLNAVYSGPFVTDARRHFSKNGCPAYKMGADFLNGNAIEQAYLATILKWAARHEGVESIDKYMALHQFDLNANKL